MFRRDYVDAVGLDSHSVFNFKDLHPGIATDYFGQEAFVIRRQMLDKNKSHAGIAIGRHT